MYDLIRYLYSQNTTSYGIAPRICSSTGKTLEEQPPCLLPGRGPSASGLIITPSGDNGSRGRLGDTGQSLGQSTLT
jgi:hypothetical protein